MCAAHYGANARNNPDWPAKQALITALEAATATHGAGDARVAVLERLCRNELVYARELHTAMSGSVYHAFVTTLSELKTAGSGESLAYLRAYFGLTYDQERLWLRPFTFLEKRSYVRNF